LRALPSGRLDAQNRQLLLSKPLPTLAREEATLTAWDRRVLLGKRSRPADNEFHPVLDIHPAKPETQAMISFPKHLRRVIRLHRLPMVWAGTGLRVWKGVNGV